MDCLFCPYDSGQCKNYSQKENFSCSKKFSYMSEKPSLKWIVKIFSFETLQFSTQDIVKKKKYLCFNLGYCPQTGPSPKLCTRPKMKLYVHEVHVFY